MTLDTGTGEVTIDISKEMEKTEVQISAAVGTQTVSTPKLQYEVYDCSTAMVFAKSPRYQVSTKAKTLKFDILASNSRPKLCGQYTIAIIDNPASIKTDVYKKEFYLDLSKELLKTQLQVEVSVGIQKLAYTFVGIEIFDCEKVMVFPELDTKYGYRYQIDKNNNALFSIDGGFKSNSDECPISSYSLTNEEKGISMDTSTGLIKFGYTKNIPETTA